MDVLAVLSTPIHEYGISFYLFVSFSISFIHVLWFSGYSSFTSVKFIPKCFIVCDVITNGIVFIFFR